MDSKRYFPLDSGGHSRVFLLGVAEKSTQWFEKQGHPVEKEKLASKHSHSSWETFSTRDKALVLDEGRIPLLVAPGCNRPLPSVKEVPCGRLGSSMDIGILDV